MTTGREGLALVAPTRALESSFMEMVGEFEAEGDPRYGLAMLSFEEYLASAERFARGDLGRPDRVRMTTFWLVRAGEVLGGSRLRHALIPVLERDGGHIGYDIRPSLRGRGLGHAILALTLDEARRAGLTRVLLTCSEDNLASLRVIAAAGGEPAGRAISPNTGERMRRHWIELGPRPSAAAPHPHPMPGR